LSILLLKPNSNSSISESSESKSENFFFSFELVCLSDIAAIAAGLSSKPVTGTGGGTVIEGGGITGTAAEAGGGITGTAAEAGGGITGTAAEAGGDDGIVLVDLGEAKRSSFSSVEMAAAAAPVGRVFLVGAARVLMGPFARSLNKQMFCFFDNRKIK